MIIPISNPALQNTLLAPELLDATQNVIRSGEYILGQHVKRFEMAFSMYTGAKHCLGVNSGTDALYLALRACGVEAGHEVIVPAMTFVATAEAVARTGAWPVFCDIQNDGRDLIDIDKMKELITERTKAIIVVHLHGYVCEMTEIMDIAADHNIAVIEDCAQATGASTIIGDKRYYAGTMGHVGCFSFFPTKNLGAIGDGGCIITNEDEVAKEVEMLRQHGGAKNNPKYIGENSRLDGLQAAYLTIKLDFLDEWNASRKAIAQRYQENFLNLDRNSKTFNLMFPKSGYPSILMAPLDDDCVYHHYSMTVPTYMRNDLVSYLHNKNIGAMVYYPHMIPAIEAYQKYGRADCKNAFYQSQSTISLPMYPELTKKEVQYIVQWFAAGVEELALSDD